VAWDGVERGACRSRGGRVNRRSKEVRKVTSFQQWNGRFKVRTGIETSVKIEQVFHQREK
jgi:hypothetical protein